MAVVSGPYMLRIELKEFEQPESVFRTDIVIGAEEVTEAVDSGVIREVDGVSGGGICCETRVFEHTAVEEEFEHEGVGTEPTVGVVVSFEAEAVVGDVRAEVIEEFVGGAIGKEIEVEFWGEVADMDPAVSAVGIEIRLLGYGGEEEGESN